MRVAWVLLAFASVGIALIAYFVLAFIMPKEESDSTDPWHIIRESLDDLTHVAANIGLISRRRSLLAVLLIGIRVVLLLSNLGVLWWWKWEVFWPLVLVGIGVVIFAGRLMRSK